MSRRRSSRKNYYGKRGKNRRYNRLSRYSYSNHKNSSRIYITPKSLTNVKPKVNEFFHVTPLKQKSKKSPSVSRLQKTYSNITISVRKCHKNPIRSNVFKKMGRGGAVSTQKLRKRKRC